MSHELYFLSDLKRDLIKIADEEMPRFSGQNDVLQILVEFKYQNQDSKELTIMFWHPNNAMMVAHSYLGDDNPFQFRITANHSTAWRHDGLDFFHNVLPKPDSWEIIATQKIQAEIMEAGGHAFVELINSKSAISV